MKSSLNDLIDFSRERLNALFSIYLQKATSPSQVLQTAMHYSVTNGGKRLRPLFVYAVGSAFDVPWENCDAPALSIELVHAFSLIHDDLPDMDNSDLRRGKPTCHKQFGNAIALLAGDALLTLAFEVIATHPCSLMAEQRLQMVRALSQATGMDGMTAGQVLDLAGVDTISALSEMYQLKTGALFQAAIKMGLIAANVHDLSIEKALQTYIDHLSLAFQIQDDLLDLEGQPELTGKTQGIDIQNNKLTYPILYGKKASEDKVKELFAESLKAIAPFQNQFELLKELAHSLIQRSK